MTDSQQHLHLQRLQHVRAGMEKIHAEALAERGGRIVTTEATLALIEESNPASPNDF